MKSSRLNKREGIYGFIVLMIGRGGAAGLGLLQVIILAYMFGTGNAVDSFFVAQSIPFFFLGTFENVLNTAFLPVFI